MLFSMKAPPAKIISILIALVCLLAAGWFTAKLQYGKQQRQQQAKVEKMQKNLELMQKSDTTRKRARHTEGKK
jgi:preprotein translocase subunit YajC